MIPSVMGLDTSNYRTSLALVSMEGKILLNLRELLPVPSGNRGLRQSDALYLHLKQIKCFMEKAESLFGEYAPSAVCASVKPRDLPDSYMPVFEVGETIGRCFAAARGIPFFPSDHQSGHIMAAKKGTVLACKDSFLAIHLSGGTTDLLEFKSGHLRTLGSSLDLYAGQLVDRTGVAMGCSFPAGPELEKLARNGACKGRLPCSLENSDLSCHLSGAESQVQRWIQNEAYPPEDIAIEVYDLLVRTVCRMVQAGARKTGLKDILIFGGIASSELFREMLLVRLPRLDRSLCPVFGEPMLSGDNAVGTALIGLNQLKMSQA